MSELQAGHKFWHPTGLMAEVGATLTGRRTFERADGSGGQHPWDVPAFVATHHVPDGWPRPGSTVQFVIDGIESAVVRAKTAAAPKSVGVHGAQTTQQCLDAGLLDEIASPLSRAHVVDHRRLRSQLVALHLHSVGWRIYVSMRRRYPGFLMTGLPGPYVRPGLRSLRRLPRQNVHVDLLLVAPIAKGFKTGTRSPRFALVGVIRREADVKHAAKALAIASAKRAEATA
jgi:hypothetical protein